MTYTSGGNYHISRRLGHMHIRRQADRRAPGPAVGVSLAMFTSGLLPSKGVIGGNGGGGAGAGPPSAPHGQGKTPIVSSSSSSFFKGIGSNSLSSAFSASSSSSNHGREGGGGGASMEGKGEGNPHIGVLIMKSRKGGGEEVRLARRKERKERGRECCASASQMSRVGCMDTSYSVSSSLHLPHSFSPSPSPSLPFPLSLFPTPFPPLPFSHSLLPSSSVSLTL